MCQRVFVVDITSRYAAMVDLLLSANISNPLSPLFHWLGSAKGVSYILPAIAISIHRKNPYRPHPHEMTNGDGWFINIYMVFT